MESKEAQWVTYFKGKKGYDQLFFDFRKKFMSLGRVGGSVKLDCFSREELEEFALFLGNSPDEIMKKGSVSLIQFEKCLSHRRFPEITLHQLLEAYFNEEILTKKEQELEKTIREALAFETLKVQYQAIEKWLLYLEKRTADTRWIRSMILEKGFLEEVSILHKAYVSLPSGLERYPFFSQRITGDPHSFDLTTTRGRLWIHLLYIMSNNEGAPPTQAEIINELLLSVHLLRDDIANFVTIANLYGFKEGAINRVWQMAVEHSIVLNVPLRELLKVDRIKANSGIPRVFVVENSGVFSALVDAVPYAPLVCMHGQFKLAGLKLLDLLVESGHTLYYSGDFDPEGISMALRFLERYQEKGKLWRMTISDYYDALPVVELGERKRKLEALKGSKVSELVFEVEKVGKIGYQEGIINRLITDLSGIFQS